LLLFRKKDCYLQPRVFADKSIAVRTFVYDILAIVDAEGNEAASKAEAKDEKKDANQPAKTTGFIDSGCCDGSMARWANAHNRRRAKADWLNRDDSRNCLNCNGSGCSISNGLWSSSISNRSRLTSGHFSSIGVHGRLTSRLSVVHFRSRCHCC